MADMLLRIGYNLFLFLSILTLPWQSYWLFIIAGLFIFDNFFEGIAWAIIIDVVYGLGLHGNMRVSDIWHYYFFTTTLVGCYFLVAWSKHYLTWYD